MPEYFVSATGSDSANGLTPETAFRTLTHWASIQRAGDVVNVGPGEYPGVFVRVPRVRLLSDPANPAVILPFGGGHNCIRVDLTESADRDSRGGCVTGFTTRGGSQCGIWVTWANGHEVGRNTVFDGGLNGDPAREGWGIKAGFTDDLLILDNEIVRTHGQHGIYFSDSGDRPTIRGNRTFFTATSGIQINADASQGGDGVCTGAVVEGNTIVDAGMVAGPALNFDGIQDSTIHGNRIVRARKAGVNLHKTDAADVCRRVLVTGNVVQSEWTSFNVTGGCADITIRTNTLSPARAGDVIDEGDTPAVRLVLDNAETRTPFTPEFLASLPAYTPPLPPPPPPVVPPPPPPVVPDVPATAPLAVPTSKPPDLRRPGQAFVNEWDNGFPFGPLKDGSWKGYVPVPVPGIDYFFSPLKSVPRDKLAVRWWWLWEADLTGVMQIKVETRGRCDAKFADRVVMSKFTTNNDSSTDYLAVSVTAGSLYLCEAGLGGGDHVGAMNWTRRFASDQPFTPFNPMGCFPEMVGTNPPPTDDPTDPPPPGGFVWGPIWDHPDYPKLMKAIHGG
jgi:hypothetical protein